MKKYTLLLILIWSYSSHLYSQTNENESVTKNQIGFQIGLNNTLLKDLVFSPLNYSGQGIGGSIFYERLIRDKHYFISRMSISVTPIQSRDLEFTKSLSLKSDIELIYLHQLKQLSDKVDLYAGAILSSEINYVEFGAALTYFNFHGLQLAGRLNYKLSNKHRIVSTFKVPIVGLFVRPAYTGWDNEYFEEGDLESIFVGKLTSLNDFFEITWTNLYAYELSRKLDLTFQIQLQYLKTTTPELAKTLNTQFSIGTNLKF